MENKHLDELKRLAVAVEKDPTQGHFITLLAQAYIQADVKYERLLRPVWESLVKEFQLNKVYKF